MQGEKPFSRNPTVGERGSDMKERSITAIVTRPFTTDYLLWGGPTQVLSTHHFPGLGGVTAILWRNKESSS